MPVPKLSPPPAQFNLVPPSGHDYHLGAIEQTYFGLVDVQNGNVYLVVGPPLLPVRAGRRTAVPQFGYRTAEVGGQPSHVFAATSCNVLPRRLQHNIAGFSVRKGAAGPELTFRSSYNCEAFTGWTPEEEAGGDARLSRIMPVAWSNALGNFLANALLGQAAVQQGSCCIIL